MNVHRGRVVWVSVCVLLFSACTLGLASSDDRLVFTDEDLRDYMNRWLKRDGLAVRFISDYFLEYLGLHTESFLEIMSERPEVYDSWIQELEFSFIDFGGCMDLRCLRCEKSALIHALEISRAQGDAETLRVRLLARLREVTVRKVK